MAPKSKRKHGCDKEPSSSWIINTWSTFNITQTEFFYSSQKCALPLCSLSLVISPFIAKRKHLQENHWKTLSVNGVTYPIFIFVHKSAGNEISFLDNGCLPLEIESSTVFEVLPLGPWNFAERIVFSTTDLCRGEDIDFRKLSAYVKKQMNITSFYIKPKMKICVRYLTQNIFLLVSNITSSHNSKDTDHEVAYRAFDKTRIEIKGFGSSTETILNYSQFGGYEDKILKLRNHLDVIHTCQRLPHKVEGVLISGPPGVGKSFIGEILSSVYGEKCLKVSSQALSSFYRSLLEERIKHLFDEAYVRAPAIIFIDDIDDLCPNRESRSDVSLVNTLLHLLDGVQNEKVKDLVVIGTAKFPDSLDPALRRPGRLSHDFVLPVPQEIDRVDILEKLLSKIPIGCLNESVEQIAQYLAGKTPGFTAGDLKMLLAEARLQSDNDTLDTTHFEAALRITKPSSLKKIKAPVNPISFEDIIGYSDLNSQILDMFKVSYTRSSLFEKAGLSSPMRYLFFGPSGCGKSMMVQALATRFNLSVIVVKRSNVFGKYFGESEKNLAKLFDQARESAPCILHFENFESLAGKKSKESDTTSDVEGRVINHLKVMLGGVVQLLNIFVIAETNRPHLLDKNVIRQGRFHKYYHFDLPSPKERLEAFQRLLKGFQLNDSLKESLVESSSGYSMAEIRKLCQEANSSLPSAESSAELEESKEALLSAFENVVPSTSRKLIAKYEQFAATYDNK